MGQEQNPNSQKPHEGDRYPGDHIDQAVDNQVQDDQTADPNSRLGRPINQEDLLQTPQQ